MKLTVREFKEIVDLLKDDVEVLLSGNGPIKISNDIKEAIEKQHEINEQMYSEPIVIDLTKDMDFSKCSETDIQNKMVRVYAEQLGSDLNKFMGSTCISEEYVPRTVREFYQELVDGLALFNETRVVDFGSLCNKFNNMAKEIDLPLYIHKDYCRLANMVLEVDDYYDGIKTKLPKGGLGLEKRNH